MKLTSYCFISLFLLVSVSFSQIPQAEIYSPSIPLGFTNTDWTNGDLIVSSTEPFSRPSGVYNSSNNTLYVAVPDTNISVNRCLVILQSSNNGRNWSIYASVTPSAIIPKVKMVNAGADSIYCFFMFGTTVYIWNIVNNFLHAYTEYTTVRDFDVVASSTHSLYFFIDVNTSNTIYRRGSSNGGVTWTSGTVTSTGAIPRLSMSGTGDTLVLNYYNALTADTGSSAIVNFRYRESAPGTLSSVGLTTPIAAGTFKDQFQSVIFGNKVWLFYTTGTTGNIDLNCIQSDDKGATWGTPFTIGSLTGRDEYWFDAKYYSVGSGGVDLIWYSDSLTTTPTNVTDRLYYSYINYATPTTYGAPVQISQHWPFWSDRMYIPSIVEYYNTAGDLGALWVGGPSPYKLYWDGYGLITRVNNNQSEIPGKYALSQNYPNPFNPVTKIDFSIPKSGLVTVKIYDILGKEVEVLINKEYSAGNYTIDFDASKFSSGIYFYKLSSGSFSETKKMILIK